jgi:putative FmdB family regulatory protein
MPIYEYACQSCEHVTEALRSMRDADEPIACDKCGSVKTRRMHSVFATGGSSSDSHSLPMGGCGRCGDPNGSCGL